MPRARYYELVIVNGMFALAVFVQLGVYSITKIKPHWAPLEHWRPYFGLWYGLAFLGVQLWYCRACRRRRGYVWVGATWAVGLIFFGVLAATGAGNPDVGVGGSVALTAGLSAVALWLAFHKGWI